MRQGDALCLSNVGILRYRTGIVPMYCTIRVCSMDTVLYIRVENAPYMYMCRTKENGSVVWTPRNKFAVQTGGRK